MSSCWIQVALDVPLHKFYDYRVPEGEQAEIGERVLVEFNRKKMIGLVVKKPEQPDYDPDAVQPVLEVFKDLPPLPDDWLEFARFAGSYYQRPLGEVVMPAMPTMLRRPSAYKGKTRSPVERLARRKPKTLDVPEQPAVNAEPNTLNPAQRNAVDTVLRQEGFKTFLLHGVTGSGKTEVYLTLAREVLKRGQQVLILVPEINLTPQFLRQLHQRFAGMLEPEEISVFHSSLSEGERLHSWVKVQQQKSRIILGTRMAIFAPITGQGLIVVDEEHDPSYKQQDGLRYSARDLAVWRGRQLGIPVVLGSATPSLESWHHAKQGRYQKLELPERARSAQYQPKLELIDTRKLQLTEGLIEQALSEIEACLGRGHQALVFLNRRGWAPILHCGNCGWNSQCTRCSVYTVLHRTANGPYFMQCHHCGLQRPVPRACPDCGNQDLRPLGHGTQRLEEFLKSRFPTARIQRIDADSTRRKGQAQALFEQVHQGDVDIMVGTQMVSKGHDFRRLELVCIINADCSLFSPDFRASERLFSQLLQVAGRAGRHMPNGKVLLQTSEPQHVLYQTLIKQDFSGFADTTLEERKIAGLPPYSYQTLITAQARDMERVMAFLTNIKAAAESDYRDDMVTVYDPVPLRVQRVMHMERAQLLLESVSRPRLQRLLDAWLPTVAKLSRKPPVQYFVEVDPLVI